MSARPRARSLAAFVAVALASATMVAVVLPASTAHAVMLYDPAVELNPTGGTNSTNGLDITYASGQIQVVRDGAPQLSSTADPTTSTVPGLLNGIYLRVGGTLVGPQHAGIDDATLATEPWDSITATTPTGEIIQSTMMYNDGVHTFYVFLTIGYEGATDQFYTEDLRVYVPVGSNEIVKLYRTMDTRLDASDNGAGFYDTSDSTHPTVGVRSTADPSHMLAFRRGYFDPAWTGYWSGESSCMYSDTCPATAGVGYLNRGNDFPASAASINTATGTNNGLGVMWDLAAMSGGASGTVAPDGMHDMGYDVIVGELLPTVITFAQPADTPLADGSINLPVTGDPSYFFYTSATPSVCTVGGLGLAGIRVATPSPIPIEFHAAGTCTIHADESAAPGRSAATRVTRSFQVTLPAPPAPPAAPPTPAALTSTGNGGAPQSVSVTLATGSTVMLLNGGQPAGTMTVTGGVYTLAGTVITFTPSAGYVGTPAPVTFQVTNAVGLSGAATYTPTVLKPDAPAPAARVSTGSGVQQVTVDVGPGNSITLLDAGGTATGSVTVAGQGGYALAAATGVITFTPDEGFLGAASGVTFRISDTYDQSGTAAYVPTVTVAPTPTPTPTPSPTPPAVAPLPEIDRTKLVKVPANPKSIKGKERKTKAFNSSFSGVDAHPITKLGSRRLVKGEAATLSGDGLFAFDSGKLTKKGRAEVKAVVKNLKGTKTVHCEGYTDYAGDRSHEMDLSLRRAKAVCSALKDYGAKVVTMTRGYGPKRPAVVGGSAKSRKENRRVVILVTK